MRSCVCVHVRVYMCMRVCVCHSLSFLLYCSMCQYVTDVTRVSLRWVERWLLVATWFVACSVDLAPKDIETSTSIPLSAI